MCTGPSAGVVCEAKTCFVGMKYADRDRRMAALIRAGVPVDIYGPGWGIDSRAATNNSAHSSSRIRQAGRQAASYLGVVGQNVRRGGLAGGVRRMWKQALHRRGTKRLAPLFVPHAKGSIAFTEIASTFARYQVVLNSPATSGLTAMAGGT